MKFYEFGAPDKPVIRGNIHINHDVLGSSDLDQEDGFSAKFKAWLIGEVLFGMFQKGKLPKFMEKRLGKKPAEERQCYDKMLDMFGMNNIRILTVFSAKSGLNLHCFIGEFENILCNLTKFYLYA